MRKELDIAALQRATAERLREVEQRPAYDPDQPVALQTSRRYPVSRPLSDYCAWFPDLPASMLPGARLLEIGAGEGIALRELVARYGVTATATTLIAAPGSDFVTATAAALPFADNSFDVVLGIHSLTWEPNQQQALAEVHRVLRPGGRAFINLARFSEISTLWFGPKFWYDFDQATYIREYEPSEVDLAAARRVPGHPPAPYNYLLTIDKPA